MAYVPRGKRKRKGKSKNARKTHSFLPVCVFVAILGLTFYLLWHLFAEKRIHSPNVQTSSRPASDRESAARRLDRRSETAESLTVQEPAVEQRPEPSGDSTILTPDPEPSQTQQPSDRVLEPFTPRFPSSPLEAQIALSRAGFSPGPLDGVLGAQTRRALEAFQTSQELLPTGELNAPTRSKLLLRRRPFRYYSIQESDLARLSPVPSTWLGKSQANRLEYETLLELVAEKGHAYPSLIRQLNPDLDWDNAFPGMRVKIPDIVYPAHPVKAAKVVIRLSQKTLTALDSEQKVLAHFPCSIARRIEKRPVGRLAVVNVAEDPNYSFNPEIFPESAEARTVDRVLIIPPGPNNPVGTAWIGLDRPGYGIHGTPAPEAVGRTESHGCIRLANWNAEHLIGLAWIGMPVEVVP